MSTGVEVTVTSSDGTSEVLKHHTSYSVKEEAIGVDATDTTGATGVLGVDFFGSPSRVAAKRLVRKEISLTDRGQGTTRGIVRTPSGSLTSTSISADQRTILLTAVRTAAPFSGSVRDYLIYVFSLVGVVDHFVIEETLDSITGDFIGWHDEVLLQIKKLLIPLGYEIVQSSSNIVVRSIRGRVTIDKRDSDFSWTMDDSNIALSVEGYWYETEAKSLSLAYPPGGWNQDVQVYQVDAGETIEIPVDISASLSAVSQPTALDFVDRNYTGPDSVYSVTGADGLPVPASQWRAAGGRISVEIGEDTRTLVLKVTGASIERYAPFQIAASSGTNDNYSSLRIVGTGVFFTKHGPVSLRTSATEDQTSIEVGATLDDIFINSRSHLYDCLAWTLSRYGGARHSITVRTTGINRLDENTSYAYPTLADFNALAQEKGWATLADANAYYSGYIIDDFNLDWEEFASESFANQAFGNVVGARTFRDGLWFRIRSSDISPGSISYTAENDTTVEDFNTWALKEMNDRGMPNTLASINQLLADRKSIADFNAAPLTLED